MTDQIRELEKITESLQHELESKEKVFEELQSENTRLSSEDYKQLIKNPLVDEI
jgi:hypothetical protein